MKDERKSYPFVLCERCGRQPTYVVIVGGVGVEAHGVIALHRPTVAENEHFIYRGTNIILTYYLKFLISKKIRYFLSNALKNFMLKINHVTIIFVHNS